MTPGSPYSRAPIVEAIFDIQVELPSSFDLTSLLKCQNKVKADYPKRKKAQQFTGEFLFGDQDKVSTSASSEQVGYVFSSEDENQMFQVKPTGFTYNRLAPYPGWDAFFAEARRLWEEYRKVARPREYKRVALRYVDRFDFPSTKMKMETYFRTYPEVSRDLPQEMHGFFFQYGTVFEKVSAKAMITQTIVPPAMPGHTSIILDIDLFRTADLPSGNDLWPLFETLRSLKNEVFEACITDAAREVIG